MNPLDSNRLVGGLWCTEVLAALSDFLDQDLPPHTVAQVNEHLRHCSNCSRFGIEVSGMLALLTVARRDFNDEIAAGLKKALRRT